MAHSIRNSIARIALVNVNTNALLLRFHSRDTKATRDVVAATAEALQIAAEEAHEAIRLVVDECTFNGMVDQQHLAPLTEMSARMVDAAIEAEALEVARCVSAIRTQLSYLP
jgi:hypothetical protein